MLGFDLSSDGRRIAVETWHDVYVLDVETGAVLGTVARELFDVPGHDVKRPCWGPT